MFTLQSNSIQAIKENIMTYFNGTLQEFTYSHEQVTEISNPDESYLGTLNLFFKEPIYESEHIIILDSDSTIGCQE
jgi:hypothetical protein